MQETVDGRRQSLRPTPAVLVYIAAALALVAACGDSAGPDETASSPDLDAADSAADADDATPGIADSTVNADGGNPDAGATDPWNMGQPDVDLESVAGLRLEEMTYTVPGLEMPRTPELHIWYPTDDEQGQGAVFVIFPDEFAYKDASIRPSSGSEPAPLLIYSHGGGGFAGQITTVARQFVRNGWIVVAPSHPGHILTDFGDALPYSFPAIRAFDVLATIDHVENLPGDHPLSGRVDTSRVLVMGHSFGGQNAWILGGLPLDLDGIQDGCGDGCTEADIAAYEAFQTDPRVVAGVSLDCTIDATLLPDEGYAQVSVPMLHMSGTEGNHAIGIFERAAAANLTWVSLNGGCHESFTGTLDCPTLTLDESLRTTAAYTVAFGTRHVLQSSDPAVTGILDGSVEVSTSAELMRSPGAP
ncbi:MAG: hypothetical protein ACI9WU_004220 [Myxococcota bacterium]|jgi:hypothetical protein